MNRRNSPLAVLAAFAVLATACDRSPADVAGPASSATTLTPSYAKWSDVVHEFSFNENFNPRVKAPSRLESTGNPAVFANDAANFTGHGSNRGYLRTIAGNYNTVGFQAEVTVTVTSQGEDDGSAIVWFGLGDGLAGNYYNEPVAGRAIFARLLPTEFFGPKVELNTANDGSDQILAAAFGQAGDGTHRLRITWNHNTSQFTFEIQTNYVSGQPFVPTATMGPISLPAGFFDGTNAHIFIGGAGQAVFDDLHVTAKPNL